jgi:hypothetical protein
MNKLHISKQKVVSLLSGIVFLFLLVPVQSVAQNDDMFTIHNDIDADVTSRLVHKDAEFAMTTNEGSVDLMLTSNAIVIQFSDRFLEDLDSEIRNEADLDEASVLAEVITSMVSTGVHSLLNHALTIPMTEIREVYYDNGKLHIVDRDGEEIFGELEIDDVYIMEDFSRRDARRFVSEAERRMI